MSKFKNGPPGWMAALLVTLNIIFCYHLGAWNYKHYADMWKDSKVELCAWSGTELTAWLAYKWQSKKKGGTDENGQKQV